MMKLKLKREEIAGLLKERGGYVSGTEMAATFAVTRAAIWKAVGLLKQDGYVIESSPSKGYRLVASPDLCISDLRKRISSAAQTIGHELIFFDSVSSTNTVAMQMASQGCSDGAVVIADSQTGGKGRLGRSWISPPGKNIYMSIVLRPGISPRDATAITLLSAVACASAVRRSCPVDATIKWPNDLIVGTRKLGGILTEIKADIDSISHAVVGIGINVNLALDDIPDEIKPIATSLLIETGEPFSRTELAGNLLFEFDRWYKLLQAKGKRVIIDEWLTMSSTIGKEVHVTAGNQTFQGIAEGIDDEGLLIVRLQDGSYRTISAGDVTLRKTK